MDVTSVTSKGQVTIPKALRQRLTARHLIESGVEQALANCAAGIDFADALHHASHATCDSMATFDDRRFARRARKLGMAPVVTVLS